MINTEMPFRITRDSRAVIIYIFIISFSFRYWHISQVGWVDDTSSHLLGMLTTNHSVFQSSDTFVYERLARDLINGKGMNIPFHPPMISFLLAGIYLMAGVNYFTAKLVMAVLSAMTCIITYLVGRKLFSDPEAITAGLLSSLSFGLIMLTGGLNTEVLFSFMIMLSLWAMLKSHCSKKRIWTVLCGIIIGITLLTRSEFLLTLCFFLLWLFFQEKDCLKTALTKMVYIGLGIFILIIPWTVRNYYYLTYFNRQISKVHLPVIVPFSLNGPLNFSDGNNPYATGGYNLEFLGKKADNPKEYYLSLSLENPIHRKYLLRGYKEGLSFIADNPTRFLYLLKEKFTIFKDFISYGFFLDNIPFGLKGYRRSIADCFVPSRRLIIPNLVLLAGGMFAALQEYRKERVLPSLFLVSTLCINLSFHGLTRSGVVFLPIVFIYQSVLLVKLFNAVAAKFPCKFKSAARETLFVLLLLVLFASGYIRSKQRITMKEVYRRGSPTIWLYRLGQS